MIAIVACGTLILMQTTLKREEKAVDKMLWFKKNVLQKEIDDFVVDSIVRGRVKEFTALRSF